MMRKLFLDFFGTYPKGDGTKFEKGACKYGPFTHPSFIFEIILSFKKVWCSETEEWFRYMDGVKLPTEPSANHFEIHNKSLCRIVIVTF